jgi:hypothetical protein
MRYGELASICSLQNARRKFQDFFQLFCEMAFLPGRREYRRREREAQLRERKYRLQERSVGFAGLAFTLWDIAFRPSDLLAGTQVRLSRSPVLEYASSGRTSQVSVREFTAWVRAVSSQELPFAALVLAVAKLELAFGTSEEAFATPRTRDF